MHRLLERYVPARPGTSVAPAWPDALYNSVAQAFDLDAAQIATARSMAVCILQGEGAWAWDAALIQTAINEAPLHYQGQSLRIDRLVQRRAQCQRARGTQCGPGGQRRREHAADRAGA